jgi:hypothetical protein
VKAPKKGTRDEMHEEIEQLIESQTALAGELTRARQVNIDLNNKIRDLCAELVMANSVAASNRAELKAAESEAWRNAFGAVLSEFSRRKSEDDK